MQTSRLLTSWWYSDSRGCVDAQVDSVRCRDMLSSYGFCCSCMHTGTAPRHFGPRLTGDIVEAIGARDIAELVAVSRRWRGLACCAGARSSGM